MQDAQHGDSAVEIVMSEDRVVLEYQGFGGEQGSWREISRLG